MASQRADTLPLCRIFVLFSILKVILMISTMFYCRDNNEILFLMTEIQFSVGEIPIILYLCYEVMNRKCCEADLLPLLKRYQERSSHICDRAGRINPIVLWHWLEQFYIGCFLFELLLNKKRSFSQTWQSTVFNTRQYEIQESIKWCYCVILYRSVVPKISGWRTGIPPR